MSFSVTPSFRLIVDGIAITDDFPLATRKRSAILAKRYHDQANCEVLIEHQSGTLYRVTTDVSGAIVTMLVSRPELDKGE